MTGYIRQGDSDSSVLRYLQIWFGRWSPTCSLAVLLVAALFLGGCGGGDDSSASSDPGDTTEMEAEMAAGMADEGAGEAAPEAGKPDTASEKTAEKPASAAEETKPVQPPAQPPAETPKKSAQAARASPPSSPPDDTRPDSVADWNPRHFIGAKRDRDPRLLDAVAFLGEHRAGDAEVVQLLEDLLLTAEDPEPEPKPEAEKKPAKKSPAGMMGMGMAEGMMGMDTGEDAMGTEEGMDERMMGMGEAMMGPRGGPGRQAEKSISGLTPSYVSLTGGIVSALGANGTDTSRQVLEKLLAGRLDLGDDIVATSAALKALADNPCLANEAILYRALTVPETFRPLAQEPAESPAIAPTDSQEPSEEKKPQPEKTETVTAQILRASTLPLIQQSASMRLRVELTKYLFGTPALELREPLADMIMVSDPHNVAAQIGLYGRPETRPENKDEFETYFTTYGASALGRILGVSSDQRAGLVPMAQFPQAGQPAAPANNAAWSPFDRKPNPSGGRQPAMPGAGAAPGMDAGRAEMEDAMRGMEGGMPGAEEPMAGMDAGMAGMDAGEEMMRPPPGMENGAPGMAGRQAERAARLSDTVSAQAFAEQSTADPGLTYDLIRTLWHANLLSVVARQLDGIESLENRAQLIALASTVPNDEIRSRLYKALSAHWKEGPSGLAAAAEIPELGVTDPGFLAVVKMLPRKERPPRRRGARQVPTSPEDQTSYDWLQTSFDTFKDLCARFHLAALNESGRKAAVLDNLPLKLHSDAEPVAAYQVDWQTRVAEKAPGVRLDTMKVCYLRFEENAQFTTRRSFYGREASQAKQRNFPTGVWFDGIGEGSQPGLKRTIDILITRSTDGEEGGGGQAEPLVIEILSVEVKDPSAD